MSIILDSLLSKSHQITKSKVVGTSTSSILLISVAIALGIMLLMYAGIMYTKSTMKQYSACRDKIIGYEQSGIYTSPDQFKLALSYCESK
jgi:phosphomannomutase